MKRMTRKLYGILILSMLATSAHAGWLSNLGQRIVNGAANTVQNNISGKVNKTIDDVMDGKIGQPNNKNKQKQVETVQQNIGTPSSVGTSTPMIDNQIDSSGMISPAAIKGKTLKFTGKYEDVEWGNLKFRGERIYDTEMLMGEQFKKLDVYLSEGTYLLVFEPKTYDAKVSVVGKHENEGIQWGYGITVKKTIFNGGLVDMTSKRGTTVQMVEVGSNGGHLEAAIGNEASLRGAMEFTIYKIPGPTLK